MLPLPELTEHEIFKVPELPAATTRLLEIVLPPRNNSAALLLPEVLSPSVMVPVPAAEFEFKYTKPALTVSPPVKVFVPPMVNVPVPAFASEKAPLIWPEAVRVLAVFTFHT